MSKKHKKLSDNLRGHIVMGVEHFDTGDDYYAGYVLYDDGKELSIIDKDSFSEFKNSTNDLRPFHPERKDIIRDYGQYYIDILGLIKELSKKTKKLEEKERARRKK